MEELSKLNSWVDHLLAPSAIQVETSNQIQMILDELISNIFIHNNNATTLCVELSGQLNDRELSVTIKDNGKAFDPLQLAQPDTSLGLDEREIGGLGIYLAKTFSDTITYLYIENQNQITFTKVLS